MEPQTSFKEILFDRDHHLTELTVNRYLQQEFTRTENILIKQHLEGCDSCKIFLETIEDFDAGFAIPNPFEKVITSPNKKPEPSIEKFRTFWRSLFQWANPQAIGAAAVVVLLSAGTLFLLQNQSQMTTTSFELPQFTQPSKVRRKGTAPFLKLYAKDKEGTRVLKKGSSVHPGDRIGFEVHPKSSGYLLVYGVDKNMQPYLCYPQSSEGKAKHITEVASDGLKLKQAVRLDKVLGQEQFVALYCQKPFEFKEIETLFTNASDLTAKGQVPYFKTECIQDEFVITKAQH